MSDIPSDLFAEILSRVPVQPLLRFRCVCKALRRIIDNPAFIKSHRHRHRFSTSSIDQLILRSNESIKLYFVSLDSLRGQRKAIAVNRPQFIRPGLPRLWGPVPAASCDCMFLISHLMLDKPWILWSPFNGEFLELHLYKDFTNIKDGGGAFCGVGYDFVTDDYKIVRIAGFRESNSLETLVYSLKLCYWRRIEDFAGCHIPWYYYDTMDSGVFADGALYWIVKVENNGKDVDHILAFDLGTETHRLLPLPPGIFERDKRFLKRGEVSHRHLHVLSGYLFLSCSYGMYCLDGWKMEDCGGIKSWIKLFSCTSQEVGTAFVDARPLCHGLNLLSTCGTGSSSPLSNYRVSLTHKCTLYVQVFEE